MYQVFIDFLLGLSRTHAPLFALGVVASIALTGLALHVFYSLIFRLLGRGLSRRA